MLVEELARRLSELPQDAEVQVSYSEADDVQGETRLHAALTDVTMKGAVATLVAVD